MIEIVYQDNDYVVFNKPSGLLVIPSSGQGKKSMIDLVNDCSFLAERSIKSDAGGHDQRRLYPCHRLDRETSGVILFAKGKANQKAMMESFRRREVAKTYVAFVCGRISPPLGTIRRGVDDRYPKPSGKETKKHAVTHYKVRAEYPLFSVVDVIPETGRKNQIRIHFRDIGHPLLGERVYAFRKDFPVHFRRCALHAGSLTWRHPGSRQTITSEAPLPEDMRAFLKQYQRAATQS
jgi:RluA family pseudouridine synthase